MITKNMLSLKQSSTLLINEKVKELRIKREAIGSSEKVVGFAY
jgi:hypothetical protein